MNELEKVFRIIEKRKKNPKKGSYTSYLLRTGQKKILAKIKEESREVVKAAKKEGSKRLIEEIDDLFYHIFVLMVHRGLKLEDLEKEERKRMKE